MRIELAKYAGFVRVRRAVETPIAIVMKKQHLDVG